MTTATLDARASMTEFYYSMLLIDTNKVSDANIDHHFETMHRFSANITKLDIAKLQGANDKVMAEAQKLKDAVEQLKGAAMNDDSYVLLLNAVNHSLQILESFLPVAL